jgi:DNA-binding response OmpR family regulator
LRRQFLNRGVRLPVIFITGNDSDANRSAALESGCLAYLAKPFSASSLIEPLARARAAIL